MYGIRFRLLGHFHFVSTFYLVVLNVGRNKKEGIWNCIGLHLAPHYCIHYVLDEYELLRLRASAVLPYLGRE